MSNLYSFVLIPDNFFFYTISVGLSSRNGFLIEVILTSSLIFVTSLIPKFEHISESYFLTQLTSTTTKNLWSNQDDFDHENETPFMWTRPCYCPALTDWTLQFVLIDWRSQNSMFGQLKKTVYHGMFRSLNFF